MASKKLPPLLFGPRQPYPSYWERHGCRYCRISPRCEAVETPKQLWFHRCPGVLIAVGLGEL